MKVMQINCVYKKGSTGKIVYDIHTVLKDKGINSVVCYGRGEKVCEDNVYKTCGELEAKLNSLISRITGLIYGGCFFSTNRLIRVIKKEKPDIVHLHCINGYFVNIYRLVSFLKKQNIATVVTHHGEFFYTANCGHAYECEKWKTGCGNCPSAKSAVNSYIFDKTEKSFKKMKKAFDGFERLVSVGVSPWVRHRAEMSPIFKDKENISVLNGIDCSVFKPCGDEKQLKAELGIPLDKKVIIHVTASFESKVKGGEYIRQLAEKLGDTAVIVLVTGNHKTQTNLPSNIVDVGRVESQQKLAEYYSMADLCIIAGKRETFSMPVAESLCCGTPVVGFLAGGPESIAVSEYPQFVEYGDTEGLRKVVNRFLDKEFDGETIANTAKKIYDKKVMAEEYIRVYKEILNK